jgi:aminopeptidase 2
MSFTSEEKEILPKNVKPLHYAIELAPDLTTFLTDGTVTIELEVLEDSSEIYINANQISVSDVKLKRDDASPPLKPTSSKYVCSHIS